LMRASRSKSMIIEQLYPPDCSVENSFATHLLFLSKTEDLILPHALTLESCAIPNSTRHTQPGFFAIVRCLGQWQYLSRRIKQTRRYKCTAGHKSFVFLQLLWLRLLYDWNHKTIHLRKNNKKMNNEQQSQIFTFYSGITNGLEGCQWTWRQYHH
jgi:hypothetical protein